MGLARDLTTGPKRKRATAKTADYAALKYLITAPRPDLSTFRAILTRVTAARMSYAETMIYTAARDRYRDLTGEYPG